MSKSENSWLSRLESVEWLAQFLKSKSGAVPGTPAFNPAWYAKTDIYWDPAGIFGGSNSNAGDPATPLLNFYEIVRRYGSSSPQFNYGQNVTVHQLSAQPAATDPVFFTPKISGSGYAALIGSPTILATFAAGTVTTKVRATATLTQVANMPAGTTAGMLVTNLTNGSAAFIDKMNGSTAVMQQPLKLNFLTTIGIPNFAGTAIPQEDDAWATGNMLQLSAPLASNLKQWSPVGGDANSVTNASVGWVQGLHIVESGGSGGSSLYPHVNNAASNTLSMCIVDARLDFGGTCARGEGTNVIGCSMTSNVAVASNFGGLYGGGVAGNTTIQGNFFQLQGDVILHGQVLFGSTATNLLNAYSDGTWLVESGFVEIVFFAWGNYAVILSPNNAIVNGSGNTFAQVMPTTGTLSFGVTGGPQVTTGSYVNSGTGAFVSGVALTIANLDTHSGLQNTNTGARFCLTN